MLQRDHEQGDPRIPVMALELLRCRYPVTRPSQSSAQAANTVDRTTSLVWKRPKGSDTVENNEKIPSIETTRPSLSRSLNKPDQQASDAQTRFLHPEVQAEDRRHRAAEREVLGEWRKVRSSGNEVALVDAWNQIADGFEFKTISTDECILSTYRMLSQSRQEALDLLWKWMSEYSRKNVKDAIAAASAGEGIDHNEHERVQG